MAICERCLAEMRNGCDYPPGIDPGNGAAIVGEEIRPLSVAQIKLLGVLWTRRGTFVHRDSLIRLVWGSADHCAEPEHYLREIIYQVRKHTDGMPFRIGNSYKLGYRLVETAVPMGSTQTIPAISPGSKSALM